MIEAVLALGRKDDVAVGLGVGTPDELRHRAEQGFTFLSYGTDYNLLLGAVRPGVSAFKALSD